jgi:hypothetical protein
VNVKMCDFNIQIVNVQLSDFNIQWRHAAKVGGSSVHTSTYTPLWMCRHSGFHTQCVLSPEWC